MSHTPFSTCVTGIRFETATIGEEIAHALEMNAGEMGKYVDDLVCMIQEAERLEISDSMRHTVELCSTLFDVLSNADSAWVPSAAREQAGMLFTIVRKAVGKAEAALVERGAWVGPTSMPMPADASAELPMAPTTGAPPPMGPLQAVGASPRAAPPGSA